MMKRILKQCQMDHNQSINLKISKVWFQTLKIKIVLDKCKSIYNKYKIKMSKTFLKRLI